MLPYKTPVQEFELYPALGRQLWSRPEWPFIYVLEDGQSSGLMKLNLWRVNGAAHHHWLSTVWLICQYNFNFYYIFCWYLSRVRSKALLINRVETTIRKFIEQKASFISSKVFITSKGLPFNCSETRRERHRPLIGCL